MRRTSIPLLLLALSACTGKTADTAADTAGAADGTDGADGTADVDQPVTGRLALTFAIDPDYRDLMQEEAIGPFWGSFYDADDVTGAGPNDGAEAIGSITVEEVDVRGEATAVLFTSDDLTAVKVTVLGFLDSDGNADPDSPDPDEKDPVTLPAENEFRLVEGETTEVEVFFGLLRP